MTVHIDIEVGGTKVLCKSPKQIASDNEPAYLKYWIKKNKNNRKS